MKRSSMVLEQVRHAMGGHAHWQGEAAKIDEFPGGNWRVACGEGRFKPGKRNAAFAKSSGVALNFQIVGVREEISDYEISVTWPLPDGSPSEEAAGQPASWSLMFHLDPSKQVAWPQHPLYHIQMVCSDPLTRPPFAGWRLPFNEPDPPRLIEFLTGHIA